MVCMQVLSMSLGGSGSSTAGSCSNTTGFDVQRVAVCRAVGANVTVVVAAGNSGDDLVKYSPASYPEVLTVTAMSDSDGKRGGQQQ
jgi:subtilisin